jgi:hypothetical protein
MRHAFITIDDEAAHRQSRNTAGITMMITRLAPD